MTTLDEIANTAAINLVRTARENGLLMKDIKTPPFQDALDILRDQIADWLEKNTTTENEE